MGLIVQEKALQVAAGMRELLALVRKHDKALFEQMRRAMSSVVLNLAEADGNDGGTARARFASACGSAKEVRAALHVASDWGYLEAARASELDARLDELCAITWALGRRP